MIPTERTPKTGIWRKYLLLGERRKILVVAGLTALATLVVLWMFSGAVSSKSKVTVKHALTQQELEDIRQQIRAEEQAKFDAALEREFAEQRTALDNLQAQLADERAKGEQASATRIQELENSLASKTSELASAIEARNEQHERDVNHKVNVAAKAAQDLLIEMGGAQLLKTFCNGMYEENDENLEDIVRDGSMAPLPLGPQECLGIAVVGDDPVAGTVFRLSNVDVARTMGRRTVGWLKNISHPVEPLDESQYRPGEDRFNTVEYMVHPVFGVFYHVNLPSAGSYQSYCFRRRFQAAPVIKALTSYSSIDHLKDPTKLLPSRKQVAAKVSDRLLGSRLLADAAQTETEATVAADREQRVAVVIPVHARTLRHVPHLLKQLKLQAAAMAPSSSSNTEAKSFKTNVRVILAPVGQLTYEASDGNSVDLTPRLRNLAEAANEGHEVTVQVATPVDIGLIANKTVAAFAASLVGKGTEPTPIPAAQATPWSQLSALPSDYMAALAGALKLVTHSQAVVMVVDAATVSLPSTAIQKAIARTISKSMLYSPLMYGTDVLEMDFEENGAFDDGGVTAASDSDIRFTSAGFWSPTGRRLTQAAARSNNNNLRSARRAQYDDDAMWDTDDAASFAWDDAIYDDDEGADDGGWTDDYLGSDDALFADDYVADDGAWDSDDEGWWEYDDDYDTYTTSEELLSTRFTSFAGTKRDLVSLFPTILSAMSVEAATATQGKRSAPDSDDCFARRVVRAAKKKGFTFARPIVSDWMVAAGVGDGRSYPEVGPCTCIGRGIQPYCRAIIPASTVEGPGDALRLNCAAKAFKLRSEALTNGGTEADVLDAEMQFRTEGVDHSYISWSHMVRNFSPTKGFEILGKAVPPASAVKSASRTTFGPEVFSFVWRTEGNIVLDE
jgi:hypothetical protein